MDITLEHARRHWALVVGGLGAFMILGFAQFMLTAEEAWRPHDRALAAGTWLQVDIPGRNRTHRMTYEYEVGGRSYRGEYSCHACLSGRREKPAPGRSMSVEYRLEDPGVSRPLGMVTQGAATYRRVGLGVGIILLATGLAGFFFGARRDEDR